MTLCLITSFATALVWLRFKKKYAGRISGSIEELEFTYRALLEEWHKRVLAGEMSVSEARVERFRVLLSSQQSVASDAESRSAACCYREAYDAAYRPVPGAIELLRRVESDYQIGIVTNHIVSAQVTKIASIGIEEYVDELIVSEEVGVAKPKRADLSGCIGAAKGVAGCCYHGRRLLVI